MTAILDAVMPTQVGIHDFRGSSKVVDGGTKPRHDVESYGGTRA